MTFDFKKAKTASKMRSKNPALFCLVLGTRGGGKSSLAGTFNKPTLLLSCTGERHSITAAQGLATQMGYNPDNITGVLLDHNDKNELDTNPDRVLKKLESILEDVTLPEYFGAVVIDGFSALDPYIHTSSTVKAATAKNKYAESPAIEDVYMGIIHKLQALHELGIDVLVTTAGGGDKSESGEFINLTPRLRGFGVVDKVIGAFDDVIIVGPIRMTDDDGKSEKQYLIQFNGDVAKSGKSAAGQARSLSFNTRITGIVDLPEYMPADLSELRAFKEAKFSK